MMKKRNDEGFALAYVVVVIFILCSIAIALMSSTLRTLQAQENMVRRMKDKYKAMGEIERFVAELDSINLEKSDEIFEGENIDDWLPTAVIYLTDIIEAIDYVTIVSIDNTENEKWILTIESTINTASILSEVAVNPGINSVYDPRNETVPKTDEHGNVIYNDDGTPQTETITIDRYRYSIDLSLPVDTFLSYEITSINPLEGGES